MKSRRWILAAGCTLASLVCGLAILVAAQASARPSQPDALLARLEGVKNIRHPYSWLLTGGQPDKAALTMLAESGKWDVMDLRTADEDRGIDERAVVKTLGLRYLPIPTSTEDFTDSRLTAFRRHLIAHGPKKPLFLHCGSGNRVGAALLPWLVLDQEVEEDLAIEMARDIGLEDEDITERALDYIHVRQAQPPLPR